MSDDEYGQVVDTDTLDYLYVEQQRTKMELTMLSNSWSDRCEQLRIRARYLDEIEIRLTHKMRELQARAQYDAFRHRQKAATGGGEEAGR